MEPLVIRMKKSILEAKSSPFACKWAAFYIASKPIKQKSKNKIGTLNEFLSFERISDKNCVFVPLHTGPDLFQKVQNLKLVWKKKKTD